jgi:hypothetical protein
MYSLQMQSLFTRAKPIFSREKMFYGYYERKGSVAKKKKSNISGRDSQGAWRQEELISGKPPVGK